jgi:hypothetical protein
MELTPTGAGRQVRVQATPLWTAFSEQFKAESSTNLQVSGQPESVLGIEPEQIVEVGTK